jgi:hypothetical protein
MFFWYVVSYDGIIGVEEGRPFKIKQPCTNAVFKNCYFSLLVLLVIVTFEVKDVHIVHFGWFPSRYHLFFMEL